MKITAELNGISIDLDKDVPSVTFYETKRKQSVPTKGTVQIDRRPARFRDEKSTTVGATGKLLATRSKTES